MDLIKTLTAQYMKPELPAMRVGDTVRVTVRVNEGNRERTQAFEGTIIAKKHGGINETITVRRISYGVGCEKVFPVHSPTIVSVGTVRRGKVRRAKLYYLRDRVGKRAYLSGYCKKEASASFLHFRGVFAMPPGKNSHNFSCRKRVCACII